MILQMLYVDEKRLQVSDGMNTAYLNIGREIETRDALCKCINKLAKLSDLVNSIFVFSDFTFEFEWDYEHKKLMVSIDTDNFDFLHPGSLHERVFRSKDLSTVLGNHERETLKRQAMKKRLQNQTFVGIEVDEILNVVSTGGVAIQEEEIISEIPKRSMHGISSGTANSSAPNALGDHAPFDKCLIRNGWLTFPLIQNDKIPLEGGLYETFESFLEQCNHMLLLDGIGIGNSANHLVSSSSQTKSTFDPENVNPNQPGQTPKQGKVRLKKSKVSIYRDADDESPIKFIPKVERFKGLSKEEEEELDQLVNLTHIEPDIPEPELNKPMRKVKTNRMKAIEDLNMAQRSPSKVAVRLRTPKEERSYSFRNREDIKSKAII